jgi:hypothetical protein
MKTIYLSLSIVALLASPGFAQRQFSVEEKETVQRSLEFAPGARKLLDVENVNGFIHVTGYDGATVEMVANETIRGRSQDRIEAAKREVVLDIADRSDIVRIVVDHPGKCRNGNNGNGCFNYNSNEDQYSVKYDFEIRVPKSASVRLRSINSGEIRAQGVQGDFDVEHINGAIQLEDMSGSGRAHTINGAVHVSFSANPKSDCSFHSLNGAIEVSYPGNLSAELRFKTLNGGVYTDFPPAVIPAATSSSPQRVRVGNGGPEMEFESLNGNIKILQAK